MCVGQCNETIFSVKKQIARGLKAKNIPTITLNCLQNILTRILKSEVLLLNKQSILINQLYILFL